jgi:hypothetical protein
MAIVQISRIQHRKGLQENLPQLAGGELGWSIDQRRLYIGNGTLVEGAPVIGNTEVLTEFSDVLSLGTPYTYKGEAAGYTVKTNDPAVERKISSKLDEMASVKDFGAVGDGETDDTDAINRAFYELFCREKNPEIRRSLYFPAGVYKVSDTILVPPYAKVWGEGVESSIIRMAPDDSSMPTFVMRTTDSLQQTGVNIGANSATLPKYIEMNSMTVESNIQNHILLIESAEQCYFESMNFNGPLQKSDLQDASVGTICVEVEGTAATTPEMITFDKCGFHGCTYGVKADANSNGFTFTNGRFSLLFRGVQLGEGTTDVGPLGYRITQNLFDDIADSGIYFRNVSKNISANNVFLDVANTFNGNGNPSESIIQILAHDNVSVGDMFERNDTDDLIHTRVEVDQSVRGIYFDNARAIAYGNYKRESGLRADIQNNQSTAQTIFTRQENGFCCFKIDYSISRGNAKRIGTLTVSLTQGSNALSFYDEYNENADTGVVLSVEESGSNFLFKYTSTNDIAGHIHYSLTHLR